MKTQNKSLKPITKTAIKTALSVATIGIVTSLSATLANVAEAANFQFSGRVTNYGFNNGIVQDGSVTLGKVVSGSYEFDCPSALCQFDWGSYWDASPNSGATVDIGNYTFKTVPYESFGSAGSEWNMIVENATSWITIGIAEENSDLDMNRVSPAGGSYSAIWMQPLPGSLAKLVVSSSQGMFQDEPDVWIEAEITSIEKVSKKKSVPEPGTIAGFALLGLGFVASKTRKCFRR